MKFKEFFEDNTFIGSQPLDIQKVSFEESQGGKIIGTFNGIEIWESHNFAKIDCILYGILDKDGVVLSWCLFDLNKNLNYLTFIRAFTKKENRGNDLMLTIINFLIEKLKKKIIIDKDEMTSSDSRKMLIKWSKYSKMKRHFTIKVLDKDKKEIDVSLDSVLVDHSENDNYLLLETTNTRVYSTLYSPLGKNGVLQDWIWY